jgi:hypothetical protein
LAAALKQKFIDVEIKFEIDDLLDNDRLGCDARGYIQYLLK